MGQNFVAANATPQEFNLHYGTIYAMPATLTVTGHVKTLHCITGGAAAGVSLQMALYTNSGGSPGTKIVESNGQAAVSGVNNFDVADTAALSPGTFWVVLASNNAVTLRTLYDGAAIAKGFGGGFNTLPTTASGVFAGNYDFAYYAGYCVDVSSPTPQPTITWTHTPSFTFTPTVTRTETPIPGCTPGVFGVNAVQTPCACGFNYFHASKYTLAAARKITGLHLYAVSAGVTFQMAVYDDLSGVPNNRLTLSNPQVTTAGWNTVSVPGTGTLTAGTYWIAEVSEGMGLGWNGGSGTNTGYVNFSLSLSNPAPGGGSSTGDIYSFYADTCP